MRITHWLACVALVGCGSSGHDDGPQAGSGATAGNDKPAEHDAGAAGHNAASGGKGSAGKGVQSGAGHSAADSGSGSGSEALEIPRVYPLVRASTPAALIADATYRAPGDPSLDIFGDDAGMSGPGESNDLAHIIRDRFYSAGPTELLRIVSELDGRTAQLDTDRDRHACLNAAPSAHTWMFPGGQSFRLQLQCMQEFGGGWLAFGFAPAASDEDAGAAVSGNDFYLVQGQDGGMGGAYRIRGGSRDVEAWITVADSRAPNNSQVIMHLAIDVAAASTELALGGSGVGFCSAHLKTADDYLFIRGKPNAPPPPGQPIGHYCASERAGCFATSDLNMDLGAAADSCGPIATPTFAIHAALDASFDPEANVMPATIYQFFNTKPQGIAAF